MKMNTPLLFASLATIITVLSIGTASAKDKVKLSDGNDRYEHGDIKQHNITFTVEGPMDLAYRKCQDVLEGLKREYDGVASNEKCDTASDRQGDGIVRGTITITDKLAEVDNKNVNLRKYND